MEMLAAAAAGKRLRRSGGEEYAVPIDKRRSHGRHLNPALRDGEA